MIYRILRIIRTSCRLQYSLANECCLEVVNDPAIATDVFHRQLLTSHTLVLNRHWLAVGFTHARRAISLVYQDVAKIIAPDTYVLHDFESWTDLSRQAPKDECVRSVRTVFRVPEIILLTSYDGQPRASVAFSRRNLCIRDRYTCQYCSIKVDGEDLTIDHLHPRSRGGLTTWENCVISCMRCNERKRDRTPVEAHMKPIRHPRKPRWSPSFAVPLRQRRSSWEKFVSDLYWDVELEP
jgi:5-methylcytosine-specific restriction endonuclease McrA